VFLLIVAVQGWTALRVAARYDNVSAVEAFLKAGADVNAANHIVCRMPHG
jgi:ankyrin repeat protein